MCDILIAKVGNEGRSGVADDLQRSARVKSEVDRSAYLVVTLVGPSELTDQSNEDQFSNLRQFCVDNSNQGGEDRGERQR